MLVAYGGAPFLLPPSPSEKGKSRREDAPGEGLLLGLILHGDLVTKRKILQRCPIVQLSDNIWLAWSA